MKINFYIYVCISMHIYINYTYIEAIYINYTYMEGKIRLKSWDMYSKLNVGQKILLVVKFGLLWLRKIEKALAKEKRY